MRKVSKLNRPRPSKRTLLITCVLIVILAVGGFAYSRMRNDKNPTAASPESTEKIDLNPPTEQDKKDVEQHKDDIVKQQEEISKPQPSTKTVTPFIVDAGYYNNQVEVRSYISEIYESSGTCTVTLVKGGSRVVKQVQGVKGATTTDCPVTTVPRSELSVGAWAVTVSYSSPTASGNSETRIVDVKQ